MRPNPYSLPAYWRRWQSQNINRLLREGLPRRLALRFSKMEANARAEFARKYGLSAAHWAILELDFGPNDSWSGRLVGQDLTVPYPKRDRTRFRVRSVQNRLISLPIE